MPPPRGVPAMDAMRKDNGSPNFNHAAYAVIAARPDQPQAGNNLRAARSTTPAR